jgi:hypothetical protein
MMIVRKGDMIQRRVNHTSVALQAAECDGLYVAADKPIVSTEEMLAALTELGFGTVARGHRQRAVAAWCEATFGAASATFVPQRALRFLEEAIEVFQASLPHANQHPRDMAHTLVDRVFDKKPGELATEIGQVGVTLLALAAAAGVGADVREHAEVERINGTPGSYFAERDAKKCEAGFTFLPPSATPKVNAP